MKTRTRTRSVIGSIISELSFTFNITSVTDNLDGTFTLTSCETFHIQPTFSVTIDGIDYPVISVVKNVNIVISGTVLPTASTFLVYAPYYYHGTPVQVSNELTEISVAADKTPMVFLNESYVEKYFGSDSSVDREADLRIFFLTQSNFEDWLSEDYHNNSFEQMNDMIDRFLIRCKKSKLIGKFSEHSRIIRQKVSVVSSDKNKKNLFNMNLSGVELLIKLPFNKENCIAPCTLVVVGFRWEDMTDTWESYTGTWESYQ